MTFSLGAFDMSWAGRFSLYLGNAESLVSGAEGAVRQFRHSCVHVGYPTVVASVLSDTCFRYRAFRRAMDPALRARLEAASADMGFDPYADTPRRKVRKRAGGGPPEPPHQADDDMRWCSCGLCVRSDKAVENKCCFDIPEVFSKGNDECIIPSLCLNPAVLQAMYRELASHGVPMAREQHKKYRFTAYRLFTRWCWSFLGTGNRVVLPACVTGRIRQEFPSASYVGFKYPQI